MPNTRFHASTHPVPDELNCSEFLGAWLDWCEFRAAKKKPVSELAAKRQLRKLSEAGVKSAVEAIDRSIRNDWQGLFTRNSPSENPTQAGRMPSDEDLANWNYNAKQI